VTADGLLLWLDDDPAEDEPADDDPVEDEPLEDESSDEVVDGDVDVDDEPADDGLLAVAGWDEAVVAPVEPVAEMTPKARTNVVSVAAAMRFRILRMRAARACRRWRTVSDVLDVGFEGMPAS
jgi:hypothetical protein